MNKYFITGAVLGLGFLFYIVNSIGTDKTTNEVKNVETVSVPVEAPPEAVTSGFKSITTLTVKEENIIPLVGEINEESLDVADKLSKRGPGDPPVFLLINSPGGSVVDGASIVSAMEASRAPVYTVCMQMCASMAAIIHQYGTQRFMLDRSLLMFHDAAGGLQGYLPHMHSRLAMIERYVLRFDTFISNRSGMPLNDLIVAQHRELWLDAEDATAKRFNDKIVFIKVKQNNKLLDINKIIKYTKPKTAPTGDFKDFKL